MFLQNLAKNSLFSYVFVTCKPHFWLSGYNIGLEIHQVSQHIA